VDLGVYLDVRNPRPWRRSWAEVYRAALSLCERVEELGGRSVWLSEHHLFDDGYLPQPLTLAAAIATRTQSVRIGTAVYLAPLRPAAQILEEAAIVDLLSEGRLDLGLGAGYRPAEFELYGVPGARPMGQMFGRVEEIRSLIEAGEVTPPPFQQRLPIWIGANRAKGARRVGRLGEGLLSVQSGQAEEYVAGLVEGGHPADSARMAGPVNVFLSDDPERDWPTVSRYFEYQWRSYDEEAGRSREIDLEGARSRGLEGGLRGCLVATAAEAAVELRRHLAEVPVATVFTWGWLPGVPADTVDRHLELWCTDLARELADAGTATPDDDR